MITSVTLVLWIFSAFYLTEAFFPWASRLDRLALGAALGIFFATWAGFLLFLWLDHGPLLRRILFCLPFFLFCTPLFVKSKETSPLVRPVGRLSWKIFGATAGVCFWVLFWLWVARQTVFVTESGIFTGDSANYGDLGIHVSYAQYFAWGNHDLRNPNFSGLLMKYHFLNDFLASLFVREGLDIHRIFQAQTFFFGTLMTWLCGIFVSRVTRSPACGWAAPVLLMTSGGVLELFGSQTSGLVWQNFLITRIMPQRSFLFGVPIFFLILIFLWEAWERRERRLWQGAGILTGLMPFASVYCFVAAMFLGGCLSLMNGRRAFLNYALPLLVLALPQVLYIYSGSDSHTLSFMPGWYESAKNGWGDFLVFWLRNTGVLWPVIFLSLSCLTRSQLLFAVPFFLLFPLGNLVRLTPDMANNYNLIVLGLAGMSPAVMIFLARIWKFPKAGPGLAVFLFFLLTAGGVKKIEASLNGKQGPYQIISAGDERFSRMLREKTRPDELVLIHPTYNHAAFWSGRRMFMTYPGWVWTYSWGDYPTRKKIAKAIYEGGPGAAKYLQDFGIDLVVIGPKEREAYKINREFLKSVGGLLFDFPDYQVYRIRKPVPAGKSALSS